MTFDLVSNYLNGLDGQRPYRKRINRSPLLKYSMVKNGQEIFASLDLDPRFQAGLWDSQKQTLDAYAFQGEEPRVVGIELPTGSGKTVIGLLVAEAHREDGRSVAYLCDTNALAERILRDADDLGIPAVFIKGKGSTEDVSQREKDLDGFRYADKLGVFSYAGLLRGSGVHPPDVLIVDDAHAFEAEVLDESSLTISRTDYPELYKELLNQLSRQPHQGHLLEVFGISGSIDQDRVELVPFTIADHLGTKIQEILNVAATNDQGELRWKFSRFVGRLSSFLLIVSRDSVAFRPYLASVWDLTVGYGGDKTLGETLDRLVLMSATLGSIETIKERFGISGDVTLIDRSLVDTQRETMGERIVVPLVATGVSKMISAQTGHLITSILSDFGKALILSNSNEDTKDLKGALIGKGMATIEYRSEADLEAFRKMKAGALLSTNRFIGLDLSSKACPVGIQVRVPYVMDPLDGLKKNVVRDIAYVDEKVVQRLTQAFGRLNRGPNDRALYFILDERFPGGMRKSEFFNHFPPELRAQVLYGWREGGDNKEYSGKKDFGLEFLQGRLTSDYAAGIEKYKRRTIKEERPRQRFKASYVDKMVDAWRLFVQGQIRNAAPIFLEIAKSREAEEPVMAAWHYYLAANAQYVGHKRQGGPLNIQEVSDWLKRAYELGRAGWFSRLPGVISYLENGKSHEPAVSPPETLEVKQRVAENWKEFRNRCPEDKDGSSGSGVRTKIDSIVQTIRSGTHAQICHELESLLDLLGYDRVVRERAEGENVDLVAYAAIESPRHILVIEVKSRQDAKSSSQIVSKDVDQVVADAKAQTKSVSLYERVLPVILTNRESVHGEAIVNAEKTAVRIVRPTIFIDFLKKYFEMMQRFWSFVDAGQEGTMIPNLPSPSALLPLFEFRGVALASSMDVEAIFKTTQ